MKWIGITRGRWPAFSVLPEPEGAQLSPPECLRCFQASPNPWSDKMAPHPQDHLFINLQFQPESPTCCQPVTCLLFFPLGKWGDEVYTKSCFYPSQQQRPSVNQVHIFKSLSTQASSKEQNRSQSQGEDDPSILHLHRLPRIGPSSPSEAQHAGWFMHHHRPRDVQVSRSSWPSPSPQFDVSQRNNKRSISGEEWEDDEEERQNASIGEMQVFPMIFHVKRKPCFGGEVGDAPYFQRTLILYSRKTGREEAQEARSSF